MSITRLTAQVTVLVAAQVSVQVDAQVSTEIAAPGQTSKYI